MRIGFATSMAGGQMSFAEVVKWAADKGFDCLEVMGSHLTEAIEADPERILRTVGEHGIIISALAPMLNLLDADASKRLLRIQLFRRTLEAASALQVPVVVTYAGSAFGMFFWGLPAVGQNHPSNKVEENLKLFSEVWGPLSEEAEKLKVKIAFENAPRGGGWGNVAHCPELWDRMFELVPSPAVGLSFDPSHLVWLHIMPIEEVISQYAHRIYHLDGKDTEIFPDRLKRQGVLGNNWWRYRIPGKGVLDWGLLISVLQASGYDYVIDIENEDEVYPGTVGLEMALQHLRRFLPKELGNQA